MLLKHGDYIRVAIPPPPANEIPTRFAVRCAQAGLNADQAAHRYCDRGDDTASLYSSVGVEPQDDVATMMQLDRATHFCRASDSRPSVDWRQQAPDTFHHHRGSNEEVALPSWTSLLYSALIEEDAVECEEEGRVGYIETWYLRGHRPHVTQDSRTFRVSQDSQFWQEDLIELWSDKVDLDAAVQFYWVLPVPISTVMRHRMGHLLLHQHPVRHLAPALLTIEFHDEISFTPGFAAALLPNPVTASEVRDLTALERNCASRRCTLHHGRRLWGPATAHEFPPGAGLTFSIHPPSRDLHVGDDQILHPQVASVPVQPDANLDLIPMPPPLTAQTHFVQNLYDIWNRLAVPGPANLERLLSVETWYLDGRYTPFHDLQRNVVLGDDFWTWEALLTHRWRDFVWPDYPVDFTLVTPTPSSAASPREVHLILYQRIPALDRPSLVTVRDNGVLRGAAYTAAVILPSAVRKADIISHMGKTLFCPPYYPSTACTCWHGALEVSDIQIFPNRHGLAFDLHVYRQLWPGFWGEDDDDVEAAASTSMLQISSRTSSVEIPPEEPEVPDVPSQPADTAFQHIEMQPALDCFEWLDNHLFLPQFDLPQLPEEHIAAGWLAHWWDPVQPIHHVRIYTDGSFTSKPEAFEEKAGAAVAAFVLQDDGWRYAGALSSALPQATSAYVAELTAITAALKLAYDIVKLHSISFVQSPEVTFCYDANSVGQQAAGFWKCVSCPALGGVLRSLVMLLDSRFGVQRHFLHVRGHSGEPGNELVDLLALQARRGQELAPFADWTRYVAQPAFAKHAEWMWMLFDQHQTWDGSCIRFQGPASHPSNTILPIDEQAEELPSTSTAEIGLSGLARQRALLAQIQAEGVLIFGLQETRLQKLHTAQDPDFFLYKSAASAQGQGGLMAGFAKLRPYGRVAADLQGPARHLFFKDDHFAVLAFGLLIRVIAPYLRLLVLVAHAPHSGQELAELERYWKCLEDRIPNAYKQWPLILLCDANAAVGATSTAHVGDFQSGKPEEKAAPFESFVVKQDLWLPATFEDYQEGEGHTWTHTSGKCRRIDYVGLPRCWHVRSCKAWVSTHIDPSLLREDHSAACAEVCFPSAGAPLGPMSEHTSFRDIDVNQITWANLEANPMPGSDVHTHLDALQSRLVDHLRPCDRRRQRKPIKQTISEETWHLVCEKRKWRSTLHEYQRLQRQTVLEQVFDVWKTGRCDFLDEFAKLHKHQDLLVAGALHHFRQLGRRVCAALRRDDCNFFSSLLADGAEFLHPREVKNLWQIVRRSLPRFQQRKVGYHPGKLAALDTQLGPHFENLETGHPVTCHQLIAHCDHAQIAAESGRPPLVDLASLPSLRDLEDSFRLTQADRSTGYDPVPSALYHCHAPHLAKYFFELLLKIFMWGCEPVQSKGGELKTIPKKPGADEAHHFRGILLLPTFAKRVHAILRGRLMQQTSRSRDPGQLGGYAGQQVAFGSHIIRTATNIFAANTWSSFVLFVDLKTAFHHLVRQLVFGIPDDDELLKVVEALHMMKRPPTWVIH